MLGLVSSPELSAFAGAAFNPAAISRVEDTRINRFFMSLVRMNQLIEYGACLGAISCIGKVDATDLRCL